VWTGCNWMENVTHLSHDAGVDRLNADLLCVEVEPVHEALG